MKLKRRKIKRGRIEVIPMIDTIVILLIFYMTFSRFVEASRSARVELPSSRAGAKANQDPGQVIINMMSTDEVIIQDDVYKTDELPGRLQRFKNELAPGITMSVILRGHKAMTYQDLSDFMRACAQAGIIDVTFATLEAQE
ncbi:biopolymer transporter ExbD [bacterium]|nr:biopolymer transporter ExbD [bacterium]